MNAHLRHVNDTLQFILLKFRHQFTEVQQMNQRLQYIENKFSEFEESALTVFVES